MSSCVTVQQLIVENPSFENLNKIQSMFTEFAEKIYSFQSKMHERIDYFENLHDTKPRLCEHKNKINGMVSVSQVIEFMMPEVLNKMRKAYGEVDRFQTSSYNIIWPIPDYTQKIKQISNNVMLGIQTNTVESIAKMNFVVTDLLGKQVSKHDDQNYLVKMIFVLD